MFYNISHHTNYSKQILLKRYFHNIFSKDLYLYLDKIDIFYNKIYSCKKISERSIGVLRFVRIFENK